MENIAVIIMTPTIANKTNPPKSDILLFIVNTKLDFITSIFNQKKT
jgi:hypothetical protein